RNGKWEAYSSVSEALSYLSKPYRHIGLTVLIKSIDGSSVDEYWFKDGIENHHLVLKFNTISSVVTSINNQTGAVTLDFVDQSEKGAIGGVAPLNDEGVIPEEFLPPISGTKIPDWEEGQSYDKDQIVIVYEGDNAVVYRSLTNDNDSSPLLTNPWEYVGEVSDIPNWDDGTDYNLGDKVLYFIEGGGESLSVLFESTTDSPSSNPLEGKQTGEWMLKAVLADPVEWDVDTEYSPYGDIYPTVVSYGSSYYTTYVSVIGVNQLSTED